jgi:cold shock protein
MATGRIKWFNTQKGYGFIDSDDGSNDVFVHITAIRQSGLEALDEGQKIEFELHQRGDGRTTANGIKLLEDKD